MRRPIGRVMTRPYDRFYQRRSSLKVLISALLPVEKDKKC
jgi:hypothetical protein